MGAVFFTLCVATSLMLYLIISGTLYSQYNSRLNEVIHYVEHNTDADDLQRCVNTKVKSEKYNELQELLNGMVDDFDLRFLYLVIPDPDNALMINVISATSDAERAAGEDDMGLLETTDEYTVEELKKYSSYWKADGINYFKETSGYGEYYTACKALKTSDGETVALICADIDIQNLYSTIAVSVTVTAACIIAALFVFGIIILTLFRRRIIDPLKSIEKSATEFAEGARTENGEVVFKYQPPEIKTNDEIESLADAIKKMAEELCLYVEETIAAEKRVSAVTTENARLYKEADSAKKIAELTKSLTVLLNNIPALTFYKEIETGKYLACNDTFAKHVGKKSTEEVVGLTDYELYDRNMAESFVAYDKKALEINGPYFYEEEYVDSKGVEHRFQTTKMKFTDATGKLRLLGMCIDVSEMEKYRRESEKSKEAYEAAKKESLTYSRIASALSKDYAYIYYVNVETDEFIEYSSGNSEESLAIERRETDFFNRSRNDAQDVIDKADLDIFLSSFTKENILEKINSHGMFTLTYRLLSNGESSYVNMKASRLKNDDKHIIIGISNVDAQMKEQEAMERAKEERTTYSRIMALSGNYICIYTVDPKTEEYSVYGSTKDYETLGIANTGKDFFRMSRENAMRSVYLEDVDRFITAFTKENVLKDTKESGVFSIDYRLMLKGVPVYVHLKAAAIEEKDGPKLIVGISNIDARMKRELDYQHNLSLARRKADMDALTGVKNKHAYIDVEANLNHMIDENEPVDFAIIVFDVNGLKAVNDNHGHVAGDQYIKSACKMICNVFKHSPVFRVGGDEFVVVARGNDYENVDALFEEINRKNAENAAKGEVTAACGMAKFMHNDRNVAAVFERADYMMYNNKRHMKNEI